MDLTDTACRTLGVLGMVTRGLIASEHEEQAAFFDYLELESKRRPELALCFAVPNGQLRDIRIAKKLKAEGVRAGVPDICVPIPRGQWHGMWIEMKRTKHGTVSPEQAWWLNQLKSQGYWTAICLGWDDAKLELEKYMSV